MKAPVEPAILELRPSLLSLGRVPSISLRLYLGIRFPSPTQRTRTRRAVIAMQISVYGVEGPAGRRSCSPRSLPPVWYTDTAQTWGRDLVAQGIAAVAPRLCRIAAYIQYRTVQYTGFYLRYIERQVYSTVVGRTSRARTILSSGRHHSCTQTSFSSVRAYVCFCVLLCLNFERCCFVVFASRGF